MFTLMDLQSMFPVKEVTFIRNKLPKIGPNGLAESALIYGSYEFLRIYFIKKKKKYIYIFFKQMFHIKANKKKLFKCTTYSCIAYQRKLLLSGDLESSRSSPLRISTKHLNQ
uniref:Uncharacterized protein n=1 Tax=Glossina brevipalpis TaxID=37001 RepID=A0A1A9WDL3_9MUSC